MKRWKGKGELYLPTSVQRSLQLDCWV